MFMLYLKYRKSTFGMSVALDQGIIKCISTDTVRAVMRSFVNEEVSPALHRSSYAPAFDGDDPVRSWKETASVLQGSVEGLIEDSIARKTSLVVEGVHIKPSTKFIDRWEEAGGVAIGVLLQVTDPDVHKGLLTKRGFITGNKENEEKKIKSYDRVRTIQEEMIKLAREANWLQIEQKVEPDPLDMVNNRLVDVCMPVSTDHFSIVTNSGGPTDTIKDEKPKIKIEQNLVTVTANESKDKKG